MTTLYELYNFFEKCDTETLIQQITNFTVTLTNQFGDGYQVRYLNNLNKIQNLYSLMKFQFENGFTESTPTVRFQKNNWEIDSTEVDDKLKDDVVPSPLTVKTDNLNPKPLKNPSDKYKNMESGDIHFAESILPYKISYIRDLCRKRLIPFEKPKGKYVFYKSKLEEWLKQNGSDHRVEMLSIGKRVRH